MSEFRRKYIAEGFKMGYKKALAESELAHNNIMNNSSSIAKFEVGKTYGAYSRVTDAIEEYTVIRRSANFITVKGELGTFRKKIDDRFTERENSELIFLPTEWPYAPVLRAKDIIN